MELLLNYISSIMDQLTSLQGHLYGTALNL